MRSPPASTASTTTQSRPAAWPRRGRRRRGPRTARGRRSRWPQPTLTVSVSSRPAIVRGARECRAHGLGRRRGAAGVGVGQGPMTNSSRRMRRRRLSCAGPRAGARPARAAPVVARGVAMAALTRLEVVRVDHGVSAEGWRAAPAAAGPRAGRRPSGGWPGTVSSSYRPGAPSSRSRPPVSSELLQSLAARWPRRQSIAGARNGVGVVAHAWLGLGRSLRPRARSAVILGRARSSTAANHRARICCISADVPRQQSGVDPCSPRAAARPALPYYDELGLPASPRSSPARPLETAAPPRPRPALLMSTRTTSRAVNDRPWPTPGRHCRCARWPRRCASAAHGGRRRPLGGRSSSSGCHARRPPARGRRPSRARGTPRAPRRSLAS